MFHLLKNVEENSKLPLLCSVVFSVRPLFYRQAVEISSQMTDVLSNCAYHNKTSSY